jgi:hypothetical protein
MYCPSTLTGNEEKMSAVLRDTKLFHEHTVEEAKKEIERHKGDVAKARKDYDIMYSNVSYLLSNHQITLILSIINWCLRLSTACVISIFTKKNWHVSEPSKYRSMMPTLWMLMLCYIMIYNGWK